MSNNTQDTTYIAPLWQRFTSYMLTFVMLGQICLPITVQAVELMSDGFIQSELNASSQFERTVSGPYQYQKAFYIDEIIDVNTQSIAKFHQRLLTHRKAALAYPQMIPIVNGDITIIIPHYPLAKRIGDEFVQARFIRSQIFNVLNRNLISDSYADEQAQIHALYNQAYDFSARGDAKFGAKITRAQVNQFGKDFIWPELRLINGESVLVPVVHITDATETARKVNGHQIEFSGDVASFNNITVNAGTIFTRRNTYLQTAGNFTINEGAAVIASGDLNLIVGGTLQNLSGRLTAQDNVNIIAKQYSQKTVLHRFATRYEQGTRLGEIASVDAINGNVSIRSYGDIVIAGGTISGNNIVLRADGNIQLTTQYTTYVSNQTVGGYDVNQSIISHTGSKLSALDSIYLMASGAIEINAATLTADEGVIKLLAEQGIYITNEFNEFQTSRTGTVGKVTLQESEFQTIAIRSALEAGKGVLIASDFGDVTLKATQIKSADGAQINALNGKVNMLLAKEQDHYFMNRVTKGTWTIKTETQTDKVETAVYNGIIGGVKVQATHGLTVEFAQEEGVTLQDTLDMFSGTEDLAWMAAAYNDPAYASNIEVVYQELLNLHEYDSSRSLSPAAMAIIAIAMAVAMGPAGFGAIGGTGAGTIGTGAIGSSIVGIGIPAASLQAGALAIATQAATSLASGNNLGETLKSLTAKGNITSLATAMVTAGVLSEIGDYGNDFFGSVDPNAPLLSADTLTSIGNQATQAVIHSSVSAGISTVIHGGDFSDFGDSFQANLKQAGINAVGQYLASSIGKSFKDGDTNNIVRYLAHAGAGCVIGLAANAAGTTASEGGESCMTGAGGAVVGELVADAYKAKKLNDLFNEQQTLVDELTNAGASKAQIEAILLSDAAGNYYNTKVAELTAAGVDLAKLAGGLSALIAESDVNLGAMTAENAAKNNAFFLIPIALMILKAIDIALTANELHDIYQEMQTTPASGNKMLVDWLEDQAMGGLISKAIPGFKTMEDMLDWLRRNDVLAPDAISKIQQQISHKKSTDLGQATPDNRIEVYNASTNKLDLNTFQGDEFIAAVDLSHLPKGKRVNDGFLGEIVAKDIFENATGLPFKDLIKNGANNGADLFAIDAKSSTIWLVEVKSSIRDSFPDPSKLNLEIRGWKWIEDAARFGTIAGKTVEPAGIAYANELLALMRQGYVIKPMLAKVSVPAAGSSGVARVTINAAK